MKKVIIAVLISFSFLHAIEIEKFSLPIPEKYKDYISSGQGLRDYIEEANISENFHNAIDWAVPDKTPVYAAKTGIVRTCYPSYYNGSKWKGHKSLGGLIIIEHFDRTVSLYAHLSYTEVTEGTFVVEGQEIGLSGGVKGRRGSGTLTTGPHLHFAMYLKMDQLFKYGTEED